MAYGMTSGFTAQKTPREQNEWQKQTPYAAKNNIFAGGQPSAGAARQAPAQSVAVQGSPVTPDGSINQAAQAPPLSGGSTLRSTQGPYPGRPATSDYVPGQLPSAPLGTYQAGQFTQFAAPNQGAVNQDQTALLHSILQQPHSISDQAVAQMKEAEKEQLLTQAGDDRAAREASAAARGVFGGGTMNANEQLAQQALNESLLRSNRTIDLAKTQQDRADELAALESATSVLGGQMNRAAQGYGQTLAGEQAQTGENQFGFTSESEATKYALQRALAQEGLGQAGASQASANYGQDLDAWLRNKGIDTTYAAALTGFESESKNNQLNQLINLANILSNYDLGQGGQAIDWARVAAGL